MINVCHLTERLSLRPSVSEVRASDVTDSTFSNICVFNLDTV